MIGSVSAMVIVFTGPVHSAVYGFGWDRHPAPRSQAELGNEFSAGMRV
jgi:hypothetical protein